MKRGKTKRNPEAGQKVRAMRERPKMPPISEEMKQWSAMLGEELRGWPQVSSRQMFSMTRCVSGQENLRCFARHARHWDSQFCFF